MVTRLKLNMDTGEASFGSGNPQTPTRETAGEYTPDELRGVKPYASMAEFIADTQTPEYKGNPLDPRPGEAYRANAERRLAAMEYANAARAAHEAPTDVVGQIVALNPGMQPELAQAAVRAGAYINTEHQVSGLSDAKAQNSENAMRIHEARVTLSMLEGR